MHTRGIISLRDSGQGCCYCTAPLGAKVLRGYSVGGGGVSRRGVAPYPSSPKSQKIPKKYLTPYRTNATVQSLPYRTNTMYQINDTQRGALTHFAAISEDWLRMFKILEPTDREITMNATIVSLNAYAVANQHASHVFSDEYHAVMIGFMSAIAATIESYLQAYRDLTDKSPRGAKITVSERWHFMELFYPHVVQQELERMAAIQKQLADLAKQPPKAKDKPTVDDIVGSNDFYIPTQGKN